MNSLIIVGAGITGLSVAEYLKTQIPDLAIIEKSKSVGGRMATRRDSLATYDHGAQFYKHSTERPFPWHNRWLQSNKTQPWFTEQKFQGYCGINGMTALAKDLAIEKKIHFDQKVVRIHQNINHLRLETETGELFDTQFVVLTSPLPQSLEILKNSKISFPEALVQISFAKALVGLFEIDEISKTLFNEHFKKPTSSCIYSISNNQLKNICQNLCLTVVMDEEFSEIFFAEDDFISLEKIKLELFKVYGKEFKFTKSQLKKWRFSHPRDCFADPYFEIDSDRRVILAGDAFGGPSLYGAVKSAQAVAKMNFFLSST